MLILTGPAEGKLGLDATAYLISNGEKTELENAFVCIHLKGYSMARVTHLDIEHDVLDNLIPPKLGGLHEIGGVRGGIQINLEGKKKIEYRGKRLKLQYVLLQCPISKSSQTGSGHPNLGWRQVRGDLHRVQETRDPKNGGNSGGRIRDRSKISSNCS